MIATLSSADRQSWLERCQSQADRSPDGTYESLSEGDQVLLRERQTGQTRTLSVPNELKLERTSVANGGQTVAFAGKDSSGAVNVFRARPGQSPQLVENRFALYGIDLSPTGQDLAYISLDEVKLHDGQQNRTLARLPSQLDEVHYLEDGRMLVQGHTSCWTSGRVATFWVLNEDGQSQFLDDPDLAEELSPGTLSALDEGYQNAFPMADPAQRKALMGQFGYHTPTYRIPSPTKDRMVFSVKSRFSPTDARQGIYLVQRGHGQAQRIRQGEGVDLVAGRELSSVTWSADGSEAALVLARGSGDAYACVVGAEADKAVVLPYRVDQSKPEWSESGRYLAVQVVVDDLTSIFCFDTEKRAFFPVVTGYRLEGWKQDRLLVRRGEEAPLELEPNTMDPRFAPGQLFGSPLPEPGLDPGVRVEPDHVVVGGVRVPRKVS
ncbi:hypothetical protein DYH09_32405 [bacterium CPR1]|nr:hypothetical protein [bacterium CPR1]